MKSNFHCVTVKPLSSRHVVVCLLLWAMLASAKAALAQAGAPDTAAAMRLRAQYSALLPRLSHSPFQRPLTLDSAQTSTQVSGDIYAVLEHPFSLVSGSLGDPANWCDVLILHLNTKACRLVTAGPESQVMLSVGKKFDQRVEDAFALAFAYHDGASTSDYFEVHLDAATGPVGTHDYEIALEAVALNATQTFTHLHYAYGYGVIGKIAMQLYFLTSGRDKIGFTVVGQGADGQPRYVGGLRGLLERNTLRYDLAIDAYLATLQLPPEQRLEQRLQAWFAATEKYAPQLHEMEWPAYLEMKRNEIARMAAASR